MPALTALIGTDLRAGAVVRRPRGDCAGQISLGEFVAFYTYMVQLVFPMIALGFVTNIFQRGAASMGRLNYILDAQPSDPRSLRQRLPPDAAPHGDIEFRHPTFAYPTTIAGNGVNFCAIHTARQRRGTSHGNSNGHAARHASPARHQPAHPGRLDAGHRRPHGQRQEHARRAGGAPLGSAREHAVRSTAAPSAIGRWQNLRRAIGYRPAGHLSLQRNRARKHRLRRWTAHRRDAVADAAEIASIAAEIAEFPGEAIKPWSASAASPFPAAKSSAPRWRARCFAIRAS